MTGKAIATRISRILAREECKQAIPGSVSLIEGVLTVSIDGDRSDAKMARDALLDNHLNIDIDPNSSETRIKMVDGMAVIEFDVVDPLWRATENTPPNRMVKL
jgi:hypothetical protein